MITQPSSEIYNILTAAPKNFLVSFFYNFFSPDEYTNSAGVLSDDLLVLKSGEAPDSSFLQRAVSKFPRMVVLSWNVAKANVTLNSSVQHGSLINDHVNKDVVTEDSLSKSRFLSISYYDGETNDKLYSLVSGSYSSLSFFNSAPSNTSYEKIAGIENQLTPDSITHQFLQASLTNMKKSAGATFFASSQQDVPIVNVTLNNKFSRKILESQIVDPTSTYSIDAVDLHGLVKHLNAMQNVDLSSDDYTTTMNYFDLHVIDRPTSTVNEPPELVGYVIDKFEVSQNGATTQRERIIVEGGSINKYVDFKVKYGTTYCYAIRPAVVFTLPALDDNRLAYVKVLVLGKQSGKSFVQTLDGRAPPPPADVDFRWDYDADKLVMTWNFPINSQRDIKKFQVFRRASINKPYQLLKVYDFNDSKTIASDLESSISPNLIEKVSSPKNSFIDVEFNKTKYHNETHALYYAVASIDAHGLTSNYSMQFAVWFDSFTNKLKKKLISHSGAPKPYPNVYLLADAFVDTIRVSGPSAAKMHVIFNPQQYFVKDNNGNVQKVVRTLQENASYKINVINLDNQKSDVVTITIDDRTSQYQKHVLPQQE